MNETTRNDDYANNRSTTSVTNSPLANGSTVDEVDGKQEQQQKQHEQLEERQSRPNGFRSWLSRRANDTLSHEGSTVPLAWQALLTGLVDALIYSKSQIWTGFQTGNMVQFSQNIAQYMLPQASKAPLLTLERALSVISFIIASFIGARLGNRFGHSNRAWLITSAVAQSILLFGASAILLAHDEAEAPSFRFFPPVIVLSALSMGLQSVASQKLSSPAFATTVAFTATLTQIASDPFLFHLGLAPVEQAKASFKRRREERKREIAKQNGEGLESQLQTKANQGVKNSDKQPAAAADPKPKSLGRDRRMLGIFALCVGAGVAECLIQSPAGVRGGMTVAAGFKMIQALLWLYPEPSS